MKPLYVPGKTSEEHKFKYQSPIESTINTADLVGKALDAQITVTTRELLAVAPEVRRQVKDLISGKRVAANSVEVEEPVDSYLSTFLNDERSTFLDVSKYDPNAPASSAAPSLPLRVIYPAFSPGFYPECILDGGAQIVVMRRDIWERLGVPVAANKTMTMESANSGTTTTLSLVENHPVTLGDGDVTIHLQIQVVEDAPFEVLLGRPFFDVTNCTEVSRTGGSHLIKVVDPKTKNPFIFPTQPRPRKEMPPKQEPAVNFRQ